MTVYIAVELFRTVLNDVRVFFTHELAEKAEQGWFSVNAITEDLCRGCKAHKGTEFIVRQSELKS